jgi:hypothetical protein
MVIAAAYDPHAIDYCLGEHAMIPREVSRATKMSSIYNTS